MIHTIQSSTAVQILLIAWQTRTPFQHDRISTTLLGIIQSTPNNKNTNDYNSLLKAQYKRRQSTVSLLFLYIYHYFKKIIFFFFRFVNNQYGSQSCCPPKECNCLWDFAYQMLLLEKLKCILALKSL